MPSGRRSFSRDRLGSVYDRLQARGDVIYRHDVDFSLKAALEMAEWEAERGIKSTYYLFFDDTCPFYTRLQAHATSLLLLKLAHDVGLHVDARKTDISDLKGGKVSFHCPTEDLLWREFSFLSAYAQWWKGRYIADSGGSFRFGDPEDLIKDDGECWQLNLHPEWWFDPGWYHDIPDHIYEDFFYEKKPNFVDSRRGRAVRNGEKTVWAFDPRPWSPHVALWVSPDDYRFVVNRGYALIDGQKAVPFLQACDERQGFLRLVFEDGNYVPPPYYEEHPDVMEMP